MIIEAFLLYCCVGMCVALVPMIIVNRTGGSRTLNRDMIILLSSLLATGIVVIGLLELVSLFSTTSDTYRPGGNGLISVSEETEDSTMQNSDSIEVKPDLTLGWNSTTDVDSMMDLGSDFSNGYKRITTGFWEDGSCGGITIDGENLAVDCPEREGEILTVIVLTVAGDDSYYTEVPITITNN